MRYSSRAVGSKVICSGAEVFALRFLEGGGMTECYRVHLRTEDRADQELCFVVEECVVEV